jgi:hypothetical protein
VAPRHRILYVVIGALFAHFVEIGVFSVAFFWLSASAKSFFEPHFSDLREGGERLLEAFLLSIESYPSLGMTALHASRELRLVSGIESLTGLLLIGWTTAYTFLAMTEFWKDH